MQKKVFGFVVSLQILTCRWEMLESERREALSRRSVPREEFLVLAGWDASERELHWSAYYVRIDV
jgi:hypothetical protein